jgi:hypothetical protein
MVVVKGAMDCGEKWRCWLCDQNYCRKSASGKLKHLIVVILDRFDHYVLQHTFYGFCKFVSIRLGEWW